MLAKGYSGIRVETLEALLALLNAGVHPHVPSRGSVGASGDLAPLAHIALALVGEGDVWDGAARRPAAEALRAAGLTPVRPAAKEGLALVNGTQASTAVLALAVDAAARLAPRRRHRRRADHRRAARLDCAVRRADPRRPPPPRASSAPPTTCAGWSRAARSTTRTPTAAGSRTPTRCAASRKCTARPATPSPTSAASSRSRPTPPPTTRWSSPTTARWSRAATSTARRWRSPPTSLAIGVVQLATISERRSERLVNPALSGLPAFLTRRGGLESGLMLAQVTAAALTSELKTLAHPSSVDTIPTSANQEDHVSMSMHAALKAERAVALAAHVLAVELVCACQAIDLLAPLASSAPLMRVHARVRAAVPRLDADRPPAPDIEAARRPHRRRRRRVRVRRGCQLILRSRDLRFGLTSPRRLLSFYTSFAPPCDPGT